MAEIVTVSLTSLIASTGSVVQATITTNIGVFSASVGLPPSANAGDDILRDFTAMQSNVESYLVGKNPVNLRQIDETIKRIENLDPTISIVLSMACARAAARHRGLKLYSFLAEIAGTSPALPTPAVTVLSRAAGPLADGSARSQEVALLPSTSSSFLGAVEVLLQASRNISKLAAESNLLIVSNPDGCVRLKASLAEITKLVTSAVTAEGSVGGLKMMLDLRGSDITAIDGTTSAVSYVVGGVPPAASAPDTKKPATKAAKDAAPTSPRQEVYRQNGTDFIESVITSWIDNEFISVEDPAGSADIDTLRLLKTKITATLDAIKSSGGSKFGYAFSGVGEDPRCNMQIIADGAVSTADDIRRFSAEAVYNALKIRLLRCATVTETLDLCVTARQQGWALVAGAEENVAETADTFIADLAVAVGAGQFICGGFANGDHSAKFNRLLEIRNSDESLPYVGRRFRC